VEKYKLPVLTLKSLILLPRNELRLEIDNKINKLIINYVSQNSNKLFIVTQNNPLEETPDIEDMPTIGVIAEISSNLELPNGKTRVLLKGLERAICYEYNRDEYIFGTISPIEEDRIEPELNIAISRKLKKELDSYIKMVPSISNSVIAQIDSATTINTITDIIVNYLQLSIERKRKYLECPSALKRTEMILEDIYQEEALFEIEKRIDAKVKDAMEVSQKDFVLREKIKIIKEELGDYSIHEEEVGQLYARLIELNCSKEIREKINFEIQRYESLSQSSPEIGILRNYIESLLSLPWDSETDDLVDLKAVRKKLDSSHYGLDDVKNRIIEYLAVKEHSNKLSGPIICLIGPPGTGKTTLASSIAKSINRNFVKISVGGIDDEAEILGHRRSYIGASPGRIIDGMKRAESSNPVFLIDEVDKMSKGLKGDPASALLEVLDSEQNKTFRDAYLEIEYDLSKVMFILTANSLENIPLPLLDRLEIIDISGYTEFEKKDIAKKYLIPKICKTHGLAYLKVYDQVILDIIRHYTKEAGVRDLERQFSKVIRKIVTLLVTEKDIKFKPVLTINNLEEYLGKKKFSYLKDGSKTHIGIVSALSYTPYGGEVLPIEVNYFKGNGNLILTGSLGEVMKESATIALSYIKSNCKDFEIEYDKLCKNDIHIHIPNGAVSKDGPSAGVTLVTSLISAFSNIEVDNQVAMTGEITLRGNVLPVGGLKEKCIGALRNNIKKIFIPEDNLNDLSEIPVEIKEQLEFIPVGNYMEIYSNIKKDS
jgi:ATP-dependent Lon protease